MELARNNRLAEAASAVERVLERHSSHPDALQLLGLIRRRQGDPTAAEALLRKSLSVKPDQPHVRNNLGNILKATGRLDEAIGCYREACAEQPDYTDARLNLGISLLAAGRPDEALQTLNALVDRSPQLAGAWAARGNALKELARPADAEESYRRALDLDPKQVTALHNLGILCKQAGRTVEALDLIQAAARLAPRRPEIHYNRAHALLAAGRLDDALDAYGMAIQLKPDYAAAHDSLNKVMWQYGRGDAYLSSYRWAVEQLPAATEIRVDWADRLILAGRSAEAAAVLAEGIGAGHASAALHHCMARALSVLGHTDEAETHFTKALAGAPGNPRYLMDLGRLQIVQERYDAALRNVEAALAALPDDQEAIAYRGVCWRLLGDPREQALNDYSRFVRPFRLLPPDGYPDIQAFNRELSGVLERLHGTVEAPAEQTLRNGTQTLDDLFESDAPEIGALRRLFERAVKDYIESLEGDRRHPLIQRRTGNFRFSGSWSVRLRSGGFHVNHVHSGGWISSCYYVSVPDCVRDENDKQGWLRFGRTNLQLGDREPDPYLVRPEEGLLVLFPSFFFHGTTPFREDRHRLTVAFDVLPA